MKIGVKYCGGCNPIHNRKEIYELLINQYKEVNFEIAKEDIVYDIVLIINGCCRACADHKRFKGIEKIFINSKNDYSKLKEILDKLFINRRSK